MFNHACNVAWQWLGCAKGLHAICNRSALSAAFPVFVFSDLEAGHQLEYPKEMQKKYIVSKTLGRLVGGIPFLGGRLVSAWVSLSWKILNPSFCLPPPPAPLGPLWEESKNKIARHPGLPYSSNFFLLFLLVGPVER